MKLSNSKIYGLVGILLLSGCQSDPVAPNKNGQESVIELMPLTTPFLDIQRMGSRAEGSYLPDGYVSFDALYPTTTPPNKTIGVFLTPEMTSTIGNFIYEGKDSLGNSIWRSTVTVVDGRTYYIYGFMPHYDSEVATIAPLNGDFANGAILSVNNYRTLTAADVCAVVGVRNATAEEKISGPLDYINLGYFQYDGKELGENRIFVLLKHLYAGIHFKAFIGTKYHKMRDIEITGVELEARNIPDAVNLTLTLTANDTNTDPLSATYDLAAETGPQTVTLFPFKGSGRRLRARGLPGVLRAWTARPGSPPHLRASYHIQCLRQGGKLDS